MAIPNSPLTRSEEYLNNIATGEGAIPDVPLTRIEQYLDYIAKNGGSGGGGSSGGVLVVTISSTVTATGTAFIADKTVAEIREAMLSGGAVFKMPSSIGGFPEDVFSVTAVFNEGMWSVSVANPRDKANYTAESLDDYPKRLKGGAT